MAWRGVGYNKFLLKGGEGGGGWCLIGGLEMLQKRVAWQERGRKKIVGGVVIINEISPIIYYINHLNFEHGTSLSLENLIKHQFTVHFTPLFPFYNSWKHQKIRGFPKFLGDIEKEHCHEIG